MQNQNDTKQTAKTSLFSVRLSDSVLNGVNQIAQQNRWSRNQTITFLLEEQLKANPCQK
jgi:hypothetical protein